MRASEGARTLQDVRANIQKYLHGVRDTRARQSAADGSEPKERWIPKAGARHECRYLLCAE